MAQSDLYALVSERFTPHRFANTTLNFEILKKREVYWSRCSLVR